MTNIFEKIILKQQSSHIIYEDKKIISILDIFPKNYGHFLVIPKKKSTNLFDIDDETLKNLIVVTRKLALHVIKKIGAPSFKLLINNGSESGQMVFHTHIHIIPTKTNGTMQFDELAKYLYIQKLI